jgi:5-methylthioadenosine/S-adenosylhomocysteine deaminase
MSSILIHNGVVLTFDVHDTQHAPGWVWVVDDRIVAVGAGAAPARLLSQAGRVLDATHMAVLPGLVNAHTHLSQTFMRGLGDDKPLLQWLKQIMWPIQAAFTSEDMRLASLLGLVENVRCGVTAVNQHHKLPAPAMSDAAFAAAQAVGLRMQLARGWVDLGDAAEAPDAILAEMERLFDAVARGGRRPFNPQLRSHGPLALLGRDHAPLRRPGARLGRPHPHPRRRSAGRDRAAASARRLPSRRMAARPRRPRTLTRSWCTASTSAEAEQELIAASGAVVVHCPTSNMVLASGIAPIPALLRRGVPVALGTDGSASHNSQDVLETLKTAVLLAKVGGGDPTAITSMDALRMLTTNGAKIMGRADLGRLAPGFKADVTLVNLNHARAMPVHRAESALVYNCNGPDVDTVMVDGRILLDHGVLTMLDEAALLADSRRAAHNLLARAGLANRQS